MLKAKVRKDLVEDELAIGVLVVIGCGVDFRERFVEGDELGECNVLTSDDYNNYVLSWLNPEGETQLIIADGADLDFFVK